MSKAFLFPVRNKLILPDSHLAAAPQPVQLSDSESEKLQLGQAFATVRQITESCTAICNTQFSLAGDKPDWYDGLNNKLNTAKKYADIWLNDYSVAVSSTIPSSVITFVPVFDGGAAVLQGIIDRSPRELSTADADTAREVVGRMLDKVNSIILSVEEYAVVKNGSAQGKLITWQKDMRTARQALQEGSNSIQAASTELRQQIDEYNAKIDGLKADIQKYNSLVALGGGLVGGGAFVGSIGGGLCFEFPVVGGIVLAVGIGMIIGGSVTWGVMRKKINDANREIVDLRAKVAANHRTVTALQSLNVAASNVIASADNAITNVANFASTWASFAESLDKTREALGKGGKEASGALLNMDLVTAKENWADVKNYAQGLLGVSPEIKKLPASQAA